MQQTSGLSSFDLTPEHAPLSIIDLSPSEHQPMHSGDGRFTIVLAGEIYSDRELRQEMNACDYLFHTDSDFEVLLAAWAHCGVDGLRWLTGMFASAVCHRRDGSLTLGRGASVSSHCFISRTH